MDAPLGNSAAIRTPVQFEKARKIHIGIFQIDRACAGRGLPDRGSIGNCRGKRLGRAGHIDECVQQNFSIERPGQGVRVVHEVVAVGRVGYAR